MGNFEIDMLSIREESILLLPLLALRQLVYWLSIIGASIFETRRAKVGRLELMHPVAIFLLSC